MCYFVFFELLESALLFPGFMSSKHRNINFNVNRILDIGSLSFLDVKICGKNGKFNTNVYRKATFDGVFTDYGSFIVTYKRRWLIHTLLHRSFSIRCDFRTFHLETDHLKIIPCKNNYPQNFIGLCIKSFLNNLYTPKVVAQNVPRKIFLLSCHSWKVLLKFGKGFKNKLMINWRLVI